MSIPVLLLFVLASGGLLTGQAQNKGKAAVASVKVSEAEAATHLITNAAKPEYPPEAMVKEIQGTVILQVVVGKNGSIEKLKTISGNPMLAQAFANALRQAKYRPFLVYGAPVEAGFPIEYVFKLD
jgi:TonB family protein